MKPLGNSVDAQRSPYTPAVYHYRQVYPPGAALLKVEAFDHFVFSVLQLTGLEEAGLEIQSIHMDHALPLLTAMNAASACLQYPLRLAKDSSISLLLNSYPATADRLPRWGSLLQPRKVVVSAKRGLIVLDVEI